MIEHSWTVTEQFIDEPSYLVVIAVFVVECGSTHLASAVSEQNHDHQQCCR